MIFVTCCKSQHQKSVRPRVLLAFHNAPFACSFASKNLQKTLPKRGPNPCKIDAENVMLFNIVFLGFGLDFGRSWASNLEASWFLKPQKTSPAAHFYLLNLSVFKKFRLGGLRARFWKPPGSILERARFSKVLGRRKRCLKAFLGGKHFARKVAEISPSHRTSASNASASVSWQWWARSSRSGWPAVSPP